MAREGDTGDGGSYTHNLEQILHNHIGYKCGSFPCILALSRKFLGYNLHTSCIVLYFGNMTGDIVLSEDGFALSCVGSL